MAKAAGGGFSFRSCQYLLLDDVHDALRNFSRGIRRYIYIYLWVMIFKFRLSGGSIFKGINQTIYTQYSGSQMQHLQPP